MSSIAFSLFPTPLKTRADFVRFVDQQHERDDVQCLGGLCHIKKMEPVSTEVGESR